MKPKLILYMVLTCWLWKPLPGQDMRQQKLADYYEQNIPLKIHVACNQPAYAPADTLFFAGYLLSAHGLRPIAGRQLVYIDLLDEAGVAVSSQYVLAHNGLFKNQIILPPTLTPGMYLLVAYTNWMRNSAEEFYFKKSILVTGDTRIEPIPVTPAWRFHAEGGNFVAGLTNRLVVVGKPETSGVIRNSAGETVASFTTDALGYASIIFRPDREFVYTLFVQGEEAGIELPKPITDALTVKSQVNDDLIDVVLQRPESSVYASEKLQVVIHAHAEVLYATELQFNRQQTKIIRLNKNDLPDGVLQFTVFNEKGELVAERLLFNYVDSVKVKISNLKSVYKTREAVNLSFDISNLDGSAAPSTLSFRVYRKDLLPDAHHQSITENLMLFTDVPVDVNSILFYNHTQLTPQQIDQYLISQRWKRFTWKDLSVAKEYHHDYLFTAYSEISGRVRYPAEQDSLLVSCYLQHSTDVNEVYADGSGNFTAALLFDVWDADEAFVMVKSKGRIFRDPEIIPGLGIKTSLRAISSRSVPEADPYTRYTQKRMAVNDSYYFNEERYMGSSQAEVNTTAKIEAKVGGFDHTINFSEYYIFPSMEETIREIIPLLQHRKVSRQDVVKLYLQDFDRTGYDEPVFIIDGIMTNRSDYFLNLPPREVVRVGLINTRVKMDYFGVIGNSGIVVVETRIPGHSKTIQRGKNTVAVKGLSREIPFLQKNNTVYNRIPDLRSTLLWAPHRVTNMEGKVSESFFTADDSGVYTLIIEGLTHDGRPFISHHEFRVHFQSEPEK